MKRTTALTLTGFAAAAAFALALPAMVDAQPAASPSNPFRNDPAALAAGQTLYEANCLTCHSASGGATAKGPPIIQTVRADTPRTGEQLFSIIKNGVPVPGAPMPGYGDKLKDDDIWRIVSHIQRMRAPAIEHPSSGDPAVGRQVFVGKGQCSSCHMIGGQGGQTAPDLSNIGATRKTQQIVDAMTKPLHRIYPPGGAQLRELPPVGDWRPIKVVTANGRQLSGVLINQDTYNLQMIGDDQKRYSFSRASLRSIAIEQRSRMPTDYDKRLQANEFRDVVAYLTRLSTEPKPAS